jgi:aspartyl-tRNA(Asn)/glutamyl-tRNA(Gln) amidotransferase subunit B
MLSNPSSKSTREIAEEQQLMSFASTEPTNDGTALPDSGYPSSGSPSTSSIPPTTTVESANGLDVLVSRALAAMPKEVEALKAGHKGVMNKFVGWVMRESRGRADARLVKEEIERMLRKDLD